MMTTKVKGCGGQGHEAGQDGCEECLGITFGRPAADVLAEMEAEHKGISWHDNTTYPAFDDVITLTLDKGKTPDTLRRALSILGVDLRFNTRGQREEWCFRFGTPWQPMSDHVHQELRSEVAKRFKEDGGAQLKFGRDAWHDAVDVMMYHAYVDPFLEYLNQLPEWDGEHRLSYWLGECFDVHHEDHEMAQWASRFVYLGAVWRTYEPGCKLDEVPILLGKGGLGKSTALAYALPSHMRGMFSDTLNLDSDNKVRVEATLGKVIVEISEMVGATRADHESLKAYLSRTDDGSVRLSYRRNTTEMPRRFVMVGTSDRPEPLPNDKNLRRFGPVRLMDGTPAEICRYLDQRREQLWAEAVHQYRQGVEARLPEELEDLQAAAVSLARSKDLPMEESVERFIAGGKEGFTLAEVACGVGLIKTVDAYATLHMRDSHRLGAALRNAGYVASQQRRGGRRSQVWNKE